MTNYLYFNILNGKSEKGKVSIIVNSDGSGNAGESSAVDIEFKKIGSNPTEYMYSVGNTPEEVNVQTQKDTLMEDETQTETEVV